MLINEKLFAIEKQTEQLIDSIKCSKVMQTFQAARKELAASAEAQEKMARFNQVKANFEKIEKYGSYAPDFQKLKTELYRSKREMDLDETIYRYRIAERDLQVQLDLIAKKIATAVSENLLVSAGDPFSNTSMGLPAACEIHLEKRKDIEL